jgi:AcrR family transcriptional regulator
MDRKEQILLATLSLASERGLSNVSLADIGHKVGIRKASLYNHFASKEELVAALYEYLREQSYRRLAAPPADIGAFIRDKTAFEVLSAGLDNYWKLVTHPDMKHFYRLILSERVFSRDAADILCRETERMLLGTKQLFYAMQVHGLIQVPHIDTAAVAYAMTIHGLIEYRLDRAMAGMQDDETLLVDFVRDFCDRYALAPA